MGLVRKPKPLRLSQQQEKRIAKKTHGTQNAGSGNGWKRKGDVRSEGVLWEMKRTDAKGIRITEKDWEKVRKEAILEGRLPLMHLEIGKRRLVVISEDDYFHGTHSGVSSA